MTARSFTFARPSVLIASVLATSCAITACSGGGDGDGGSTGSQQPAKASMSAAQACDGVSGDVTVYTAGQAADIQKWSSHFEKKYGVSVKVFRQSMGPLSQRFMQENQAGKDIADIYMPNAISALVSADKAGFIATYTPTNDSSYPSTGYAKRPGKWYMIGKGGEPVVWNTDDVSSQEAEQLRSQGPAALADPRWKGRIGVVDPGSTFRVLATYWRWQHQKPDKLGWDFLKKLAANDPIISQGVGSLINRLSTGEIDVALGYPGQVANKEIIKGAPLQYSYWGAPTTSAPFFTAVAANAPHPQAARCFQNWVTSKEGLTIGGKIRQTIPPIDGLPNQQVATKKSWYEAPPKLDLSWETNKKMYAKQESFVGKWHDIFGVK